MKYFYSHCRAIQPDETVLKAEKEYHDVYLASLLPIIASRIEEFHSLLINPPQVSFFFVENIFETRTKYT